MLVCLPLGANGADASDVGDDTDGDAKEGHTLWSTSDESQVRVWDTVNSTTATITRMPRIPKKSDGLGLGPG